MISSEAQEGRAYQAPGRCDGKRLEHTGGRGQHGQNCGGDGGDRSCRQYHRVDAGSCFDRRARSDNAIASPLLMLSRAGLSDEDRLKKRAERFGIEDQTSSFPVIPTCSTTRTAVQSRVQRNYRNVPSGSAFPTPQRMPRRRRSAQSASVRRRTRSSKRRRRSLTVRLCTTRAPPGVGRVNRIDRRLWQARAERFGEVEAAEKPGKAGKAAKAKANGLGLSAEDQAKIEVS